MNQPKKQKRPNLSRRQLWQQYQHIKKVLDWATLNRELERASADLSIMTNLDELITAAFQARTRLARLCNKLYQCKLDELEVYK